MTTIVFLSKIKLQLFSRGPENVFSSFKAMRVTSGCYFRAFSRFKPSEKTCLAQQETQWCLNVGGPAKGVLNRCLKSCVLSTQTIACSLRMRKSKLKKLIEYLLVLHYNLSYLWIMTQLTKYKGNDWHLLEAGKFASFITFANGSKNLLKNRKLQLHYII